MSGPRITDEAANAFIEDVIAVCKKHGLSIGHEDTQGGFKIAPYDEGNIDWFRDASVEGAR